MLKDCTSHTDVFTWAGPNLLAYVHTLLGFYPGLRDVTPTFPKGGQSESRRVYLTVDHPSARVEKSKVLQPYLHALIPSMSAFKFAVSALNREKPRSSITDLIEILTSQSQEDESYDNLPELAHSISLQSTGPAEASRALRKKIKHGNSHQKYRALVILKALMENGDRVFQIKCMDEQLIDAIKQLASDPHTDAKVKRKLIAVLASWNTQFKDDPSMSHIAALYRQCRVSDRRAHAATNSTDVDRMLQNAGLYTNTTEQKRKEKDERDAAKRKAKKEKADAKRRVEDEARKTKLRSRRPFNFEAEKPQIINSIANASQATNNLINAMKLVNLDKESVATNEHVQECFEKAKAARKTIVRYTQLVENEEMIGTLIATNEQIIAAIQTYDDLAAAAGSTVATAGIQSGLAAVKLSPGDLSESKALQPQRSTEEDDHADYSGSAGGRLHPDLQELSFGALGSEQGVLPPPMRPSTRHGSSDEDWEHGRGTLSDFSDYESEEEQPHRVQQAGPSASTHQGGKPLDTEDPFADPFAD
ncbi:hypothetical protein ID866_5190 [Astraeus odoratus]|nr:hypothetical protein ID866_5190 [Astraeus odoratus]